MKFCENCNLLCDTDVCRVCKRKNLRDVRDEDFCFFIDIGAFFCTMLEDALKDNDIEVVCVPYYPGGVTYASAGHAECRHVYVRYKDFDAACEIYDVLFSQDTESDDNTDADDDTDADG